MEEWLYEVNGDNTIRYMLGKVGKKTLVCFGINPSTAEPNKLDATLESVQRIALHNEFDGWVMFNVYPKRDTNFNDLHDICNDIAHKENIRIIKQYFESKAEITAWAAWGNHLYERDYLIPCFKEIYSAINSDKVSWVATGVNKTGSPKHPLYQKKDSNLNKFDMNSYINSITRGNVMMEKVYVVAMSDDEEYVLLKRGDSYAVCAQLI